MNKGSFNITKAELIKLTRTGKIRRVSLMTYELLINEYFFACQKNTHDAFKYIKISQRMAERMKPKK